MFTTSMRGRRLGGGPIERLPLIVRELLFARLKRRVILCVRHARAHDSRPLALGARECELVTHRG